MRLTLQCLSPNSAVYLSVNILLEIPSFACYNMDSNSPDEEKGRNTSEASKTVSNDVLTAWNAQLCKEKETKVLAQTCAVGNFCSFDSKARV